MLGGTASYTVSYSLVRQTSGVYPGTGNINADPCFATGPDGDYYLSQIAAGQSIDSPCVDAGSDTSSNLGMHTKTTRTDQIIDYGMVDIGYHYPAVFIDADLNSDKFVDFFDYAIFSLDWQQSPDPNNPNSGDITGDGWVDIYDLYMLAQVWLEGSLVTKAFNPNPFNQEEDVSKYAVLEWLAGHNAETHDVYFGTDFNDVNNADINDIDIFMGNQTATSWDTNNYDANGLLYGKTYYWRIDEVSSTGFTRGDIWYFTVSDKPDFSLGLVGWWKFDEGSGTIAHDSAGDNDGTVYEATWTTGPVGGALSFDDTSEDYVIVPDNDNSLDMDDQMTIAAWIKYKDDGYSYILGKQPGEEQPAFMAGNYELRIIGDILSFSYIYTEYGDTATHNSTSGVTIDVWQHVAVTLIEGDSVRFYINGEPAGTSPQIQAFGLVNDDPLRIGVSKDYEYFFGDMDDILIYNRALSAYEIMLLYLGELYIHQAFNPDPAHGANDVSTDVILSWSPGDFADSHDVYFGTDYYEVNDANINDANVFMGNQTAASWDVNNYDANGLQYQTTYYWRIDERSNFGVARGQPWHFTTCAEPNIDYGLAAWWEFGEDSGTIAYDSAGDNDGNLINGPVWTSGIIDGALEFDGVNDYVKVPDDQSQQITTNEITISAWIWLETDIGNTQSRIICKQEDSEISWGLEIFGYGYGGSTGNQIVFHDSDGAFDYYNCMSPTKLNTGRWYHVAVTDDAGKIRIYLDGQPDWSSNDGYGIPSNINSPIFIGATNPGTYLFFGGIIDDVRIYNRALSAGEIMLIYQIGSE